MEWTQELTDIRADLAGEMQDRIGKLGTWQRYETLVSAYDLTFTKEQMLAFYSLAEALGEDAVVRDGRICREKSAEDLAWQVCDVERLARKRLEAERVATGQAAQEEIEG